MRTNLLAKENLISRRTFTRLLSHLYNSLQRIFKTPRKLNLDFNPIGWKGSERFPILLILLLFVHQIMTIAVKGTTQQTDKRHTQKPRT